MRINKMLINTVWFGIVPKLPAILMVVLLPVITPFLTLEDYGLIGLINSYRGVVMGIVTLGLHMHLTNAFFELKDNFKLLWRRVYFYIVIAAITFSVCLFLFFIFVIPIDLFSDRIMIASIAVIPVLLYPTELITSHYYPLISSPKRLVLTRLLATTISVLLSVVLIRYYSFGYVGWVVGTGVSSFVYFILFIKPLNFDLKIYPQPDFNFRRIKKMLKIALPVMPHNLGHLLLSSSDRIVMTFVGISVLDIGLYSNGYQIGENANLVIQGLFIGMAPVLQKIYRSGEKLKMKYYYRVSNLMISVFILFCILWMKEFYQILVRNDDLQPAYIVAILICSSYLVGSTFYFYTATSLFIEKKTKKILYLTFIPGLFNIILNFIFIPIYGYVAAIYTSIFSYWIIMILPFTTKTFKNITQKMLGTRKVLIEGVLINGIVLLVSFFSYDLSILWKVSISLTFLVTTYVYFMKIRNELEL